jgi:hypothetical protein
VGKYTQFKIRRKKAPLRADSCVMPGSIKAAACPVAG